MALVEGSISDGRVLGLIDGFPRQEIISEMARWQPTTGTPQGAVLSPLLANLYLHPLDLLMEEEGHHMVRYADDFVILCRTAAEADAVLTRVEAWTETNGLTLQCADRFRHIDPLRGSIRPRPISGTACNRARGSSSWATGSRQASDGCARRA